MLMRCLFLCLNITQQFKAVAQVSTCTLPSYKYCRLEEWIDKGPTNHMNKAQTITHKKTCLLVKSPLRNSAERSCTSMLELASVGTVSQKRSHACSTNEQMSESRLPGASVAFKRRRHATHQ